jgi:hypothetical protein
MTSYGPQSDEVLAEMRHAGLHGDAARALADPGRYELPRDSEELDSLMVLVLERDAFPQRMGRVAATYADVLFGWRAMIAAVRELASDSTKEQLPANYRTRLEGIAADLMKAARSLEALMLARLLLAATTPRIWAGQRRVDRCRRVLPADPAAYKWAERRTHSCPRPRSGRIAPAAYTVVAQAVVARGESRCAIAPNLPCAEGISLLPE